MTTAEWLSTRKPVPPPDLVNAIRSAVASAPSGSDNVAQQLVAAARVLTERVIEAGCEDRSGALDLLALDALVTYAMEASLESAKKCESTAGSLLSVIGGAAKA